MFRWNFDLGMFRWQFDSCLSNSYMSIANNRWIQFKTSMNFNSDYNSKYNRNQFEIQFWFPFPRQHYFTDALCYYPMMPNRCNHKVTCFDAIRTGIFEQIIGFDDTPKTDCKMTWNGFFTTTSRSSWVMTATNISIEINDNWFFHSSRRNQHCQSSLSMHHCLRSPFGLLLPDQPCFLCLFWWQIEDLWTHPHTIWRIHRKSSVPFCPHRWLHNIWKSSMSTRVPFLHRGRFTFFLATRAPFRHRGFAFFFFFFSSSSSFHALIRSSTIWDVVQQSNPGCSASSSKLEII